MLEQGQREHGLKALIGLYSPYPQSGKGTFATSIEQTIPGTRVLKFADAMRSVVVPFVAPFFSGGEPEVLEWLSDERKDTKPIPVLGVTLRYMLQTCGTEWGRKMIHPDLWVHHARFALWRAHNAPVVIFDDLRLPNEYAMLRKEQATLIRIVRPDSPATRVHESNAQLEGMEFDYNLINEGVPDLRLKALAVAWDLGIA